MVVVVVVVRSKRRMDRPLGPEEAVRRTWRGSCSRVVVGRCRCARCLVEEEGRTHSCSQGSVVQRMGVVVAVVRVRAVLRSYTPACTHTS